MKFLDKRTGNILETENPLVADQYKKYPDKFEPADKNGKFSTLEKRKQETTKTESAG